MSRGRPTGPITQQDVQFGHNIGAQTKQQHPISMHARQVDHSAKSRGGWWRAAKRSKDVVDVAVRRSFSGSGCCFPFFPTFLGIGELTLQTALDLSLGGRPRGRPQPLFFAAGDMSSSVTPAAAAATAASASACVGHVVEVTRTPHR